MGHRNIRQSIVRAALCTTLLAVTIAAAAEPKFRAQEITKDLTVGYATRILDMNEDGKPDILVVDSKRVIWFENPGWQLHTILEGATLPDNVSIAPADIDGDGKLDFALAADWRPADTNASGSIQWIRRGKSPDDLWSVHRIGTEPTTHRIRFADIDADGREELLVVPLFGRGSTGPNFAETPVRILSYKIPADPVAGPWTAEVLNEELHVAHNFFPTDLNRDGKLDILVASFEGVSLLARADDGRWQRTLLGSGNQETSPSRGASEIKHGRLASGADYLATIEPWHGFQVVVYTRPEPPPTNSSAGVPQSPLWQRHVLDEQLKWGHAVWCADVDGDRDEELVIGVRDNKDAANPCGLRIFDPTAPDGSAWQRSIVDPGGVAIEDLAVADLDGDGRQDIVAAGRHTKNVCIYWNEKPQSVAATADAGPALGDYPPETLPASHGSDVSLPKSRGKVATVIMCMSVDCPISNEFLPAIQKLAKKYGSQGVQFLGIDPNAGETLADMAEYARTRKLEFPFLRDEEARISRRLLFSVTPEARVFDGQGKIVYRGRIDDRYRAGGGGVPRTAELAEALDELLAGKPVSKSNTRPVGCPIQLSPSAPTRLSPLALRRETAWAQAQAE